MTKGLFESLTAEIAALEVVRPLGRVSQVDAGMLRVSGIQALARLGDRLRVTRSDGSALYGEILKLTTDAIFMLPDDVSDGVSLGDRVILLPPARLAPCDQWIGRIVDPLGNPMDGKPLQRGPAARKMYSDPPAATGRRPFGKRLETGMAVFNTMLPIVRGQRIGLFAGSGVGKSSLMAHLASNMQADVVVIALVGERGRELGEFVSTVLGPEGMGRSVIVAATSDRSPLIRRRCAWSAMAVAEHFRDQGKQVLLLIDSITRFAEAHREIALAAGEVPALRGYPPSTAHMIMSLCERAGPGVDGTGDITGLFSVLVAGSDMDEPVADILRGALDGHVVLDRRIAERGRYPAIDLLRSVSRSLPKAASGPENDTIAEARALLGKYAESEVMISAGLYAEGSDPDLDRAIRAWPDLDAFIASSEPRDTQASFERLRLALRKSLAVPARSASAASKQVRIA